MVRLRRKRVLQSANVDLLRLANRVHARNRLLDGVRRCPVSVPQWQLRRWQVLHADLLRDVEVWSAQRLRRNVQRVLPAGRGVRRGHRHFLLRAGDRRLPGQAVAMRPERSADDLLDV